VRFGVAVAALVLFVGAANAASPPNVRGLVTAPTRFSCPPDTPCDPVPRSLFVAFTRGLQLVAQVKVARDGSFATRLAPGRYVIRLLPSPLRGRVYPATVLVPRGKTVRLRITVKPIVIA
jgi:hypothetical protein